MPDAAADEISHLPLREGVKPEEVPFPPKKTPSANRWAHNDGCDDWLTRLPLRMDNGPICATESNSWGVARREVQDGHDSR
jgi:hypothetical protein